jgi:hypothetical protein
MAKWFFTGLILDIIIMLFVAMALLDQHIEMLAT